MDEKKMFGIFIWINDDPITGNVLNLKNIIEPRKPLSDYKERDRVLAKCPGFGVQTGVIGKISDEIGKKELDKILVGEDFKKLVASIFDISESDPLFNKETTGDNLNNKEYVIRNDTTNEQKGKDTKGTKKKTELGKKRSHTDDVCSEAKQAKLDEKREKREREKEREAINYSLSKELIDNNNMERNMEILLKKVNSLTDAIKSIQAHQQVIESNVDNLTEMANCPKCLRTKYKLAQKESFQTVMRSPLIKNAPSTSMSPQLAREVPTMVTAPAPAQRELQVTCTQSKESQEDDMQFEVERGHYKEGETEENCSKSGLMYLGDSQFGIKVARESLTNVKACSKDITKMALNIIEFLVTPEECKNNLTMYGEGKGKTALEANKRKA